MLNPRITHTLVELADTLVAGSDTLDILHILTDRCVELLGVDAAGILLTDQRGHLALAAASTEQARMLELFALQTEEGPCLDCYHTARPVACADLAAAPLRWPRFAAAASEQGFAAAHVLPMRLRDHILGTLSLLRTTPGTLAEDTVTVAQAFADVATISILTPYPRHHTELLTEQLQTALNNRIVIEQATGALTEYLHISVTEALARIREYARDHRQSLVTVARAILARDHTVADLTTPHHRPG